MMTFSDLAHITGGTICQARGNFQVGQLLFDSRRPVIDPERALFFAISGSRHDGHQFLPDLYDRGVRQFVVEIIPDTDDFPEASILQVPDSIVALQKVAAEHRNAFSIEVIGITGSNGKTIVKEWIYQILSSHKNVVKSPTSFNSQIGVPLSVWQIQAAHAVGIFEAGISQPGEMENLERIIRPTLGIFTNIGSAHDEGFADRREKVREKMKLFKSCKALIYCRDHEEIHREVTVPAISWGRNTNSDLRILQVSVKPSATEMLLSEKSEVSLLIPFSDPASLENVMHAVTCLRYLGISWEAIQDGIERLRPLRMRLELKQARNGCYIIDDTYNNDLAGLKNALDFLSNVGRRERKSIILSDIPQTGLSGETLASTVNTMLEASGITRFIGIGPVFRQNKHLISAPGSYYESTREFLEASPASMFSNEIILIKGARRFQFERIVRQLEEKIHGTVLEVDLAALTHNLNYFRSKLKENVRLMVMVKAFAYGSGILEVANLLQYHRADYLGVAYSDEGVALRRNGIRLPIMVMNPSAENFAMMMEHDLEPEIYSFGILREFLEFLNGRQAGVHLKLDTGMHRLGFVPEDFENLTDILQEHPEVKVISIFSHLAASESPEEENFSREQARIFSEFSERIMNKLSIQPLRHLLNSPGIIHYPEMQYDMVRLGIGLYGIEGNGLEQHRLQPVSSLRTIISQIKDVKAGETVGYGRMGKVHEPKRIATIAIGYADGFPRILSNGKGFVSINGHRAPVIGNVCMDMTMIDITGIEAREGDFAEIFGENISLNELAEMCQTIPYEVLTNISQRVKRVFYSD